MTSALWVSPLTLLHRQFTPVPSVRIYRNNQVAISYSPTVFFFLFTFHWSLWLFYPFARNTHRVLIPYHDRNILTADTILALGTLCHSLLYLLHLMDSMVTVHCSTAALVKLWPGDSLGCCCLSFPCTSKLAQKPRGTDSLRSHLIHQVSATANPITWLYRAMWEESFLPGVHVDVFLLGNNIIPISFYCQCFF